MNKISKLASGFIVLFIFSIVHAGNLYGQHITNTLGTGGTFKIKDGSNTFFTLFQSNGFVELNKSLRLIPTTDLNSGVIYKGSNRFIHDYKSASNIGQNTFVGINSGNFTLGGGSFNNGSNNTGLGYNSLNDITTGSHNIGIGSHSLAGNTAGNYNIAIGSFSLETNTTGNYNISIGSESLYSNTSGSSNLAMGYFSMLNNTTGFNNVAIGGGSLELNTVGGENVAVGRHTLNANINGSNNTALGNLALNNSTGNFNTAIGYNSGNNITTGQNITLIGYNSQPSSATIFNQITLGNNQVGSLRCNVQTITSLSDARDKKNIEDLSLGLDFIVKLKPRQFNWDKREWYEKNSSDGSKMEENPVAGFIAQELDDVQQQEGAQWLNLVLKDNPEKLEATYGNLLPVMVKAIQELKVENDRLKAELYEMKNIEERMTELELRVLKNYILMETKTASE